MFRSRIAGFSAALLALCTAGAHAHDHELLLRVQDAVGTPGGPAVVVLRTYATRPVGQGTICLSMRNPNGAAPPLDALTGARVFAQAADVISAVSVSHVNDSMVVDLTFSSDSASINTVDGAFAALFFDISPDAEPGTSTDVRIDLAQSTLSDENGVPIPLEVRSGELEIRDPGTPREIAAEVHLPDIPGQSVTLSLQTNEPFSIASGQVAFRYSNRILPGWPALRLDPRHGTADIKIDGHPGLIILKLIATSADFNVVPGNIVSVDVSPNPAYAHDVVSEVYLDPALTHLLDAEGNWISVTFEDVDYAAPWPQRPANSTGN